MPALVVKLALALTAVYMLVSLINGQMQVSAMQNEQTKIQEQIDATMAENEDLSEILESGDENAYIERIARQKLGYAWPDEKVFIDITTD